MQDINGKGFEIMYKYKFQARLQELPSHCVATYDNTEPLPKHLSFIMKIKGENKPDDMQVRALSSERDIVTIVYYSKADPTTDAGDALKELSIDYPSKDILTNLVKIVR